MRLLASASLIICSVQASAQAPTTPAPTTPAPTTPAPTTPAPTTPGRTTRAPSYIARPGPVMAADKPSSDLILEPPVNSTLEIRTARRPWLLQKLMPPKTEPSVKMNPPRPPREIFPDPPSMSAAPAQNAASGDQWQPRRPGLKYNPSPVDSPADETSAAPDDGAAVISTPEARASIGASDGPTTTKSPTTEATTDAPITNVLRPTELSELHPESAQSEESMPLEDPEPVASDAVDTLDPPNGEAAQSVADSLPLETIEVRELSIEDEGTPIGDPGTQADAADGPSSEPETLADRMRASQGSPTAKDSPTAEPPPAEQDEPEPRVEVDYAGYPKQPIRLTGTVRGMQNMMRHCLRYYYGRPEDANERSNWGVLHSIMVYGADTKLLAGRKSYNAIAWIAGNNACRGQKILFQEDGYIEARSGVGLQGHQAQLLAILSLCNVPIDYSLYAGDGEYTVADLVETEMWNCKHGEELTFTLIGLSHYLDTDIAWQAQTGEVWDFEKLIREELSQPIVGAACGGTHRLMGFAHALRKRRAEGKPITGQWKRAEVYTREFINYAYRLQNRDGSMTTDWFEGREDNGDIDRKIQTTGHMVEWLLTVTPDSQLQDRRLVNAVRFLLKSMYEERGRDWKIGPKGHALRSLAMYYERVYQSGPAWRTPNVAHQHQSSRR